VFEVRLIQAAKSKNSSCPGSEYRCCWFRIISHYFSGRWKNVFVPWGLELCSYSIHIWWWNLLQNYYISSRPRTILVFVPDFQVELKLCVKLLDLWGMVLCYALGSNYYFCLSFCHVCQVWKKWTVLPANQYCVNGWKSQGFNVIGLITSKLRFLSSNLML